MQASDGNSYYQMGATKTFRWSPKTEIVASKLWRYDPLTRLQTPFKIEAAPKGVYALDITYRPAKIEDLEEAERVAQKAGNELRVRHGARPSPAPPPVAFPKCCLAEDPDSLWVAERGDTIVGFGFSWMTERFWFLSQLFVRPDSQARGIGQALLSKTLMQAERNSATNRALITPAYNIASTGLYPNNGLSPREPLYRMAAPAHTVEQNLTHTDYDVILIPPWPAPREWMAEIDEALLGFRRDLHHKFLLGGGAARAIRIDRTGRAAGYAYLSAEGQIGPLAIALGFRIEEPYVLMATQPFGNWCNYLPRTPSFMWPSTNGERNGKQNA